MRRRCRWGRETERKPSFHKLAWPGQAYRGQERVCGGINQEGLEGVAAAHLALPGPKSARGRHFKPS